MGAPSISPENGTEYSIHLSVVVQSAEKNPDSKEWLANEEAAKESVEAALGSLGADVSLEVTAADVFTITADWDDDEWYVPGYTGLAGNVLTAVEQAIHGAADLDLSISAHLVSGTIPEAGRSEYGLVGEVSITARKRP